MSGRIPYMNTGSAKLFFQIRVVEYKKNKNKFARGRRFKAVFYQHGTMLTLYAETLESLKNQIKVNWL